MVRQCLGAQEDLAPLVERIARLLWKRHRVAEFEYQRVMNDLTPTLEHSRPGLSAMDVVETALSELACKEWQECQATAKKMAVELIDALGELLEQQYAPRPAGGNNNAAGGATPGGDPTPESTPPPESTPTPPGTPAPESTFSIQLLNPGQCHSGRPQRAKHLCLGRRKQNLVRSLKLFRTCHSERSEESAFGISGFNVPATKKDGGRGTPRRRRVQVTMSCLSNSFHPSALGVPPGQGHKSLCENSRGLSFRGAAGDEESRKSLKRKKQFLASLGMTWLGIDFTQTP
jgi:hypothetical protein